MIRPLGPSAHGFSFSDNHPCRYGSACEVHPSHPPPRRRFLTPNDVATILDMLTDGLPLRVIGRTFNVTHTTVSAVKAGKIRGTTDPKRRKRQGQ